MDMDTFQTIGAVVAVLLLLFEGGRQVHVVSRGPVGKVWPGRGVWSAECLEIPGRYSNEGHFRTDPNRAIHGKPGDRWCSMHAQTVDEWFRVDLGKSRYISRFRMPAHEERGCPKQYAVEIMREDSGDGKWECLETCDGPIDYRFSEPTRVCKIQVKIVEPHKDDTGTIAAWSITDVQVEEPIILCLKWPTHTWKKR